MKSNSLLAVLVGALCVCGLVTLWISVRYYFLVKELEGLQGQILIVNRTRSAAQSLAYEAVGYGRSHPAIVPVLERFALTPQSSSTNAPASPQANATNPPPSR